MSALLLRDLRLALRSGGGFGLGLAFFLIVIVLVPFAVGPARAGLVSIAPGILWLAALLATLLTLDRLFALDAEDGSLEQLALVLPAEAIVFAKAFAHWLTTGAVLAVLGPPLGVLLSLPPHAMVPLFLALMAGTPALSFVGAFCAALTVSVKRGGLLLSLLVLPLYVPTLIFGADVARRGAEGLDYAVPLALLAALSLACVALLPFAGAAALRASLR
ncbi:MAG: heme exporter protein CcmB [Pseudomonadota bacterium]